MKERNFIERSENKRKREREQCWVKERREETKRGREERKQEEGKDEEKLVGKGRNFNER